MKKVFSVMILCLFIVPFVLPSNSSAMETTNQPNTEFLLQQGIPPLGANIPSCRPDDEHPDPVILVPGTFESMDANWEALSPLLAAKGYCVYSLNYGLSAAGPSTGPIEESAQRLSNFIDNVLELTGAKKISIVGHSQGGMMPRYYLKFLEGANKVDDLIGLVPSNHGTNGLAGFSKLTSLSVNLLSCEACIQQLTGSDFLNHLNEGNETPGDVSYTVVTTRYDEVVVPYSSAFLQGPNTRVKNITLQNDYPLDFAEHLSISYDLHAFSYVFDALANKGPAEPKRAKAYNVAFFHSLKQKSNSLFY
jgi:triacylglycerol lipase